MAVVKTILRNTAQEAIVKIAGTAAAATIDLQTDILAASQALDGATQTVNITALTWTGAVGSTITIARNGTTILTLAGEAAAELQFNEQGFVDTIENTSDISVTIAGGEAQCYLILRKASGYASKIETAQFGAYDNQSVVGS